MRVQFTASAKRDRKRLKQHQSAFDEAYVGFVAAAASFRERGTLFPAKFRVKSVQGAKGVFEFTWSFSGPDGRATVEWDDVVIDSTATPVARESVLRVRRIGDHAIFASP